MHVTPNEAAPLRTAKLSLAHEYPPAQQPQRRSQVFLSSPPDISLIKPKAIGDALQNGNYIPLAVTGEKKCASVRFYTTHLDGAGGIIGNVRSTPQNQFRSNRAISAFDIVERTRPVEV